MVYYTIVHYIYPNACICLNSLTIHLNASRHTLLTSAVFFEKGPFDKGPFLGRKNTRESENTSNIGKGVF